MVRGALRGGGARQRRFGGHPGRVDRQGLRLPRRAGGRAQCHAGVRRHRVPRRTPGPPLPAADRRPGPAVRRRGPSRTAARPRTGRTRRPGPPGSCGSLPGSCGSLPGPRGSLPGMTARTSAFADPTAQRLQPIVTGAEPETVGPQLAEVLHDPRWRECSVALISGGKSNLTYRVACDAGEVVLRRPPLGHVLPTAHDMAREFRVQSALQGTRVPVPRTRYLADAGSVLGVPFSLMERVVGQGCRKQRPPGWGETAGEGEAIGGALIETLAHLHAIDPAAVGLADFGRGAGFMERQLRRWSKQWESSKAADLPALDALSDQLARTVPGQAAVAIVHADYRLDNTVLHPTRRGSGFEEAQALVEPLARAGHHVLAGAG